MPVAPVAAKPVGLDAQVATHGQGLRTIDEVTPVVSVQFTVTALVEFTHHSVTLMLAPETAAFTCDTPNTEPLARMDSDPITAISRRRSTGNHLR